MGFVSSLFVKSVLLFTVFHRFGLAQDYGGPRNDVPSSILVAGTKIQAVLTKHPITGQSLGFCEGPAVDADGNLFFTEPATHTIYQVTPAGQASVFHTGQENRPHGMEFDPQGNLLACTRGAIVRITKAGLAETVVASGNGIDFKDLHDLTIGSNGAIYATNYKAGSMIFYISPDRKTIKQIPGVANPTGIEWLEEKKILYVSDFDAHTTWQFDVGADGALSNKRSYVPDIPGAYGITMDEKEDVYIAGFTQGSVHLYSPGKKDPFLGHIDVKGSPNVNGNNSNLVFGGKDFKTLYMTGNGGCFKIQLVIAGRKRPVALSPILAKRLSHPIAIKSEKDAEGWDIAGRLNLGYGLKLHESRSRFLIFVREANPFR